MSSSSLGFWQLQKTSQLFFVVFASFWPCSAFSEFTKADESGTKTSWRVKTGDRVAWIGGTFTERLQKDGYLETVLAIQGSAPAIHRNLGWSGDTPSGIARAVFGSQQDGFKRLMADSKIANPNVIVLGYGHAEAFDGPKGVAKFQQDLERLVSELQKQSDTPGASKPRLVYLFPPPRLAVGPGSALAIIYNQNLAHYRDAAKAFCEKQGGDFIDLASLFVDNESKALFGKFGEQLSHDGICFEPLGQWYLAVRASEYFFGKQKEWSIEFDIDAVLPRPKLEGVRHSSLFSMGRRVVEFTLTDDSLPLPPPPQGAPAEFEAIPLRDRMLIKGLSKGAYLIQFDDSQLTLKTTADELASGITFNRANYLPQIEELRAAITKKNELFFHRHRPQNETYLFLFRKHEQGNNAVEIPAFDPLIANEEERIAQLVKPKPYRIKISKAD
jgi:hypothetical protein